jgi:hypothetical protein
MNAIDEGIVGIIYVCAVWTTHETVKNKAARDFLSVVGFGIPLCMFTLLPPKQG